MGGLIDYKFIPFVGTGIFLLIFGSIFIYFLTVHLREKRKDANFDKQLKSVTNPNEKSVEKVGFLTKKVRELPLLLRKGAVIKENADLERVQKIIMLGFISALLFGTIIFKNPLGGMMVALLGYIGLYVYAMFKAAKMKRALNEQIPSFVAMFKANIQANQHPQNAMINAIENTTQPLYDQLARAKSIMEAGDFKPGIASIRLNSDNETLRQLASCIELASSSGANMVEQIEVIEKIIIDKQTIERKKRLGVNQNSPLFIVAGTFVPLSFLVSYLFSEMHRNYWFTTPNSYLILFGVLGLSLLSAFATWKVIQKIDVG